MKRRFGIVVLMFALVSALAIGCSSDDLEDAATAQVVEAGLNDVLANTVTPLYNFLAAVPALAARPAGAAGGIAVNCPASNPCAAGTAACTVTGGGTVLTFDFDQCNLITGDGTFVLDGGLNVTPGPVIGLQFVSLFINNSPAMSGTGGVNVVGCNYATNISTPDPATVFADVTQCDGQDYPQTGSELLITIGDFSIDILCDGTSIAHAQTTQAGNLVANCSINLAVDPPVSSCSAP